MVHLWQVDTGTYGFQSAFIPTLSPGTYRAYYDGFGSWDLQNH